MSSDQRDVLAVIGVVGVLLTALGVLLSRRSLSLAAQQLERTATANEAATAAAIRALQLGRERYDRHLLDQANAHIKSAKIYVGANQWRSVVIRLSDLADALTHLGVDDDNWTKLAGSVRKMEETFGHVADESTEFNVIKQKWERLSSRVSAAIVRGSAPFPPLDEEHVHD